MIAGAMKALVSSLAALLAVVTALAAQAAVKPTLRATSLTPLSVRGTGFAAQERVRLTAYGPFRATKQVQADRLGRFAARFARPVESCNAMVLVTAVGPRSRATLRIPLRECPPPPN
jgi:hypothetical protein